MQVIPVLRASLLTVGQVGGGVACSCPAPRPLPPRRVAGEHPRPRYSSVR
jgi:hypothetical protein